MIERYNSRRLFCRLICCFKIPASHPTVKPVALVADAMRDCSKRGSLGLDPFCGSGTVLIAAELTGRKARAIEIDPHYVDVAVRRWEKYTGSSARLAPLARASRTCPSSASAVPRPEHRENSIYEIE